MCCSIIFQKDMMLTDDYLSLFFFLLTFPIFFSFEQNGKKDQDFITDSKKLIEN